MYNVMLKYYEKKNILTYDRFNILHCYFGSIIYNTIQNNNNKTPSFAQPEF